MTREKQGQNLPRALDGEATCGRCTTPQLCRPNPPRPFQHWNHLAQCRGHRRGSLRGGTGDDYRRSGGGDGHGDGHSGGDGHGCGDGHGDGYGPRW